MKYIKRILLAFVIILVLVALGVFILIRFYKKEMANVLIDTLKTDYALTLKVEDADVSFLSNWPHASVELKNIYLASDLYTVKDEPLLKAESISLSFNLLKLLEKQFIVNSVSIKNAGIQLIKNTDGARNFDFKSTPDSSKQPQTSSMLSFEIKKVSIKNVQFNFINRDKKQNIDILFVNNIIRLKHAEDGVVAHLDGGILIGGLLFNESKGAFLQNTAVKPELDFSVYNKSKMIVVHPSSYVTIDQHRYNVNSFIQLGEEKKLMLRIASSDVNYAKASGLLTPKLQKVLDNFTVEKPFDINALIVAKLGIKEDPILIVNFDVKDNDVKIGNSKIPYSKVSFHGTILSLDSLRQMGNAEEGKIVFKTIKGELYDHPFTASVSIANLVDPFIDIRARLLVEAPKIKFKVAQDFNLKGNCVIKVNYSGPTNKLNTRDFLSSAMRLNADLFLNDFSYQKKNDSYTYVVKGRANVNNRDLKFENLLLKMDAGEAALTGRVENFVNYVLGYGNSLKATLNARSDYLNLNSYIHPKVATVETEAQMEEKLNKKTTAEYKQNVQDAGESNFEFNVTLFAKKLFVRKVEAQNASIEMSHKNNLLTIKSVKANTCEGKIAMKGSIYKLNKVNAEFDMEDININRMFDEFENFGQKKIQSRHLQGTLSMHAVIKAELDEKMEVITETMAADVKLKLKDGQLLNFEPVQSMSNFIFKNRDFDNVTFSELNQRFRIRGYEMDIQELEIGSNILNLFVTGIYNFKESSNINILIPWSNLKKRGKNYIPKSSGESAETSKGLKLNFSGPTSNMKLSLGHKEMVRAQ
ncbi:MAG: AsmA-like C-terminal region-containing protein [Bacteroidota bacterium]